ncbi:uncharacterized protein LOC143210389 [Lasioglossum baleicum]|uniref:uncharacterized protein LOC143210389 n=1 Tax=Lasioglossum baleicum TaxID=434251 RepID=UPI003FCE1246
MQCFKTTDQMLKAFSKLTLEDPKFIHEGIEVKRPVLTKRAGTTSQGIRREEPKCFNCNTSGHLQRDCRQPKRDWGSCYKCGSRSHKVDSCPQNQQESNNSLPRASRQESSRPTTVSLVQPTSTQTGYMVSFGPISKPTGRP